MIPILYERGTTDFNNNGLGALTEATKCVVTEERNGAYEVELQYPTSGAKYNLLNEDCFIKCKPNETSEPQIFHIYKSSLPISGIVTYYGEHIRYQLNGIPIQICTVGGNASGIMQSLKSKALLNCPFEFWSNVNSGGSYSVSTPSTLGSLLAGTDGSILDRFGGEYEFDNYTVKLHSQRGQDAGVTVRYGKNLSAFTSTVDLTNNYTHVLPYATQNNETVTGDIIKLDNADLYSYYKCYMLDLSSEYGNNISITKDNLATKTKAYIKTAKLDEVKASYKISFVQLWQTEEYKNVAALQRCVLCDTVTVEHSIHNISTKVKVVKTVYDTLSERYISMELGSVSTNFARTVSENIATSAKQTSSALELAVETATKKITGNIGGYVVFKLNANGNPEELLIMDTNDISTATKVWRWNKEGLGHSSTGYNGKYGLAMTSDGEIVADFIKTGSLNASLIKTGVLNADLIKTGTITSADGTVSIDISNGAIKTTGSTAGYTTRLTLQSGYIVVSRIKNGITQEVGKFGFYSDNGEAKAFLLVHKVTADEIVANDSVSIGGIKAQKKSESDRDSIYALAYTSPTFRLSNDSKSNVGAFYISSAGHSVLETDLLRFDGNEIYKRTMTIDGNTIKYLGW